MIYRSDQAGQEKAWLKRADSGKLQQVLLNLVANAIKFTPEGEIRVTARVRRPKGHVRFEVRDSPLCANCGARRKKNWLHPFSSLWRKSL